MCRYMLGNISYHQYITTARLQINFTNRVKDMLKFAAQVSPPFPLIHSVGDSAAYPGFFFGSRIRFFPIQDPNLLHPGSRIRIKEIKYSYPKKWFLSTQKYDPGCLSRIRILDPDRDFLPIPDPGSKGQKGIGSRIRIRNTGWRSGSGGNGNVLPFVPISSGTGFPF